MGFSGLLPNAILVWIFVVIFTLGHTRLLPGSMAACPRGIFG
jgi:hypothetical protein